MHQPVGVTYSQSGSTRDGILVINESIDTFAMTRERLDNLRRLRSPIPDFRRSVRTLIFVASSFRGGSSFLAEILRHSSALLHFQGEMQPILKLAGWNYPENNADSDRIQQVTGDPGLLEEELGSDVGFPINDWGSVDSERFAVDLLWRWIVQWPMEQISLEEAQAIATRVLNSINLDRSIPHKDLSIDIHCKILRELVDRHPMVDPYYGDLPWHKVRAYFPDLPTPSGPHSPTIFEWAPLAMPGPWQRAGQADVSAQAVVSKAPVNAYKIQAIHDFFPNARLRILHLTRNPGATIDSLREGWLSPWFFNQRVDTLLAISGYTSPGRPWSTSWWKMDFPPGWQELTHASLEEICTRQWYEIHRSILDFSEANSVDLFQLRHEDLIGGREKRVKVTLALAEWLEVDPSELLEPVLSGLPPMVSIVPPRPGKWRRNYEIISPQLQKPEITEMAHSLGYHDMSSWI
ncbi:hypothetical protein ACH34T_27160 [Actinomadura sp. 9N215]